MQQEEEERSMSLLTALYRKYWVDNRERVMEFYRKYFHTIFVTLLMILNLMTGYSAIIIYLSQWKHNSGSVETFLTLFFESPPDFLIQLMSIPFIDLESHMIWWCLFFLNLPIFTWFYSTVTQPIKKGYTTLIDWKGQKGRIISVAINGFALLAHYCAVFAWYVEHYMFDFFAGIQSDKEYLAVKSMASFGYILMAVPVFICITGFYLLLKQFLMNEDLRKMFFTWEFGPLARQSFSLRNNKADVIIGWDKATKKPIVLVEESRYLHELVVGATGTGKTSTTILTRIVQDLIRIARGRKMGVCVLEPKGDLIRDVLSLCEKLGIPKSKIKVVDSTDLIHSTKFNPFVGPLEKAAETFRGVLDALTGDQDKFFKDQQGETAALYTMLGKIRYGNMFSIIHMQKMYTDPRYLADVTEEVRAWIIKNLENPTLTEETRILLDRYDRVCSYFEDEVIQLKTWKDKDKIMPVLYPDGHKYEGRQVVENLKDKFISGAKKYVNDICMNAMLAELMVANDDDEVLDIDKFLDEGGVLLVNTALGELEELSMMFGQFFIRQFQSAVFRRPPELDGYKRCPILFDIDEFPLFINEAFERLLTLGRSYYVGTLIAIQSLGQLESVVRGYERTIMSNASNKTVFGRGQISDNELFSKQFGEEAQVEESMNESVTPVSQPNPSLGYRYNTARQLAPRFTPTDIMEQEFKGFIVQMVKPDGAIEVPIQAYGKFISETKFLKRFVKIGQAELETSKYKGLGDPMNWIQKLAIDTVEKLSPFELLDKLTKKEQTEEPLSDGDNRVESSEETESIAHEMNQNQKQNALPVRTDDVEETEVFDEGVSSSVERYNSKSANSELIDWKIEMPAAPDPTDDVNEYEGGIHFNGNNPGSTDSPGEQHITWMDLPVLSEPNAQTGTAIENLIREVTVGQEQTAMDHGSLEDKIAKEWSLDDLMASDAIDVNSSNNPHTPQETHVQHEKVKEIESVVNNQDDLVPETLTGIIIEEDDV
ncbi:hypothetical protein AWU65_03105 [Paenibacillus glucanolyticus]|uniref:TraD/TraG TraM recognition site domain-containing protein n=1 Tax=Paenibacillus glucanolyticus TaxID=59843 RepID=A0A163GI22_9BACL|nr:TraM recognition domain-containing protein [Paenibacillus glucanolyticus]KZS44983.1 hypothetical protein AWU65_03105 [Paenibacillus glucanolyticus]OMF64804.1 hypothetical protein BK142_31405 [Paenibacillus glucanolyticus]